MDRLWAPWRAKYIVSPSIKYAAKIKKCIFCQAAKSSNSKNYVLIKTQYSIAMLNIYPYNNGHIMVAPLKHIKELSKIKPAEIIDLFKTLDQVKILLDQILKPDGYNIGINISKSAGAGIPGHLHIHIVPRWRGDTNFMPTLYNTKIISQSLDQLYKQLKYAYSKTN